MTEAAILETLRGVGPLGVPANVEQQVRDWLGTVRRVTLRSALLVHCPDRETAVKVQAAAGSTARMLTETCLEVEARDAKARSALIARLRKAGVFVGEGV
jgi:hypothetical protein